jgi:hypothetical protein
MDIQLFFQNPFLHNSVFLNFQYFGFSLISLGLVFFLKNKFPSKSMKYTVNVTFICTFLFIGIVHSGQNKFVALNTNPFYHYPRVLLKDALNSDLSKLINTKSIIIREPRYPYDNEWYFSTTLNMPMQVSDLNFFKKYERNFEVKKMTSGISQIFPKDREVWLLAYNGGNFPHGYLYAGRLKYAYVIDATKKTGSAVIDRLFIFKDKKLSEFNITNENPIDFVKIINSQDIYNINSENIVDIKNRNFFDGVHLNWSKINSMEGDYKSNVRWSSGKGELVIQNLSSEMKKIKISMELATPMQVNSHVKIQYLDLIETINIQLKKINYNKVISLPPGETKIKFSSDGEPLLNGDPREIVFGIFNFNYSFLP